MTQAHPRQVSRRINRARTLAPLVLLTAAATWLWAHEGHLPLPNRGAVVDAAKGQINLSTDARTALDVRTVEASLQALQERLVTPVTLVAPWQRHAFVTPRLGGKVTAVHVREGDSVTRGQPLADVQSLELETLQLEVLTAQNTGRLSAQNLQRLEATFREGSIPAQTAIEARSRHRQNLNALEIARLKLLALSMDEAAVRRLGTPDGKRLSALAVTSPVAGAVTRADIQVGQVVDVTDHLFEVVDLSTVWVKADVLEADLPRTEVGQRLEVRLAAIPGTVFHATVQVKGLALDTGSRQGTIWAELANPPGPGPRLLPGMVGQADFLLPAPRKAVTLPADAVLGDGAERYVLVEEGPGQYARQNVVLGRRARGLVEVLAGQVVPGDRVVTVGAHELASFLGHNVLRLSPEATRSAGVRVEPARLRPVAEVLQLTGVVELPPQRRGVAFSRLGGTIRRILVDRDQIVRAGEVIAEVASPEFQDMQLDFLGNHLQVQLLEQMLKDMRQPTGEGSLPERTLRETESAYRAVREKRESGRRKLEAVGLTVAQVQQILDSRRFIAALPVKAPLGGAVVRFHAALGHTVKADHPLFEIHDLAHPLIRGYVSERQLPAVRIGQRARIRLLAEPGIRGVGVVVRSSQTVGTDDRALSVWVDFRLPIADFRLEDVRPRASLASNRQSAIGNRKSQWLPGMLTRLTLVVSEPAPTLAVPRAAVLREGTQAYLFMAERGTFERRAVITGRSDDRWVAVTAGLRPGEAVAVSGVAELQTAYATVK